MKITKKHKDALKAVENGADVYDWGIACRLRECEKDGLVIIGNAQGDPPGNKEQPYFGAIISAKGKAMLQREREREREREQRPSPRPSPARGEGDQGSVSHRPRRRRRFKQMSLF
jgi:hypothetical protein